MGKRKHLVTRTVALSELHADPANARRHGKRNLAAIRGSLKRFGQVEPLVVQKSTGRIIGGNGRLEAMLADGQTHAAIVEVDLDDAQAAALGIALNRTAELAEWDVDALGSIAPTLDANVLGDIGFDVAELEQVLGAEPPDLEDDRPRERDVVRLAALVDGDRVADVKRALRKFGAEAVECTDENCNAGVRRIDPNAWAERRSKLGGKRPPKRRNQKGESQDGEGG